ncbi:alcohol dehydrogenase catalytic domain-containing protein [Rhizobium leguminosarum]
MRPWGKTLSVGDRTAVASSVACRLCQQCLAGYAEALARPAEVYGRPYPGTFSA